MKLAPLLFLPILLLSACNRDPAPTQTLGEARRGFVTHLQPRAAAKDPVKTPPVIFDLVHYDAAPGKLAAYLTRDPHEGKKYPAIIWITGGDCNSIDDVWSPAPAQNDQTAAAYRKAGIVMMFPSLRGGNDNPGTKEGFLGEVDDVLAAADFLAKQPFVDPNRIYLGGHSTGGTLALLVSECSGKFRAVFSFGPVSDVSGYGPQNGPPVDLSDRREIDLRSPLKWLHGVTSPTFVFEGTSGQSNISSLRQMSRASKNHQIKFLPVANADHFATLAPMNQLIAQRILEDTGSACNITFTDAEMNSLPLR